MHKSSIGELTQTMEDGGTAGRRVPTGVLPRLIMPLLVASTLAWTAQSVLARLAYEAGFGPLSLTTVRLMGSCLVLIVTLGAFKRSALRVPVRALPGLFAYGAVAMALLGYLVNLSIQLVPLAVALVLMYTGPVMMVLLGVPILGERLRIETVVAAFLAAAGCYLASGGGGLSVGRLHPGGIAAGLASGVCFAFMGLAGKLALRQLSHWTVMVYGQGFGVLTLFLVGGFRPADLATVAPIGWFLVAICVLCLIPAYWVFLQALKVMSPGKVGIIITLEPVWVAAISWFVFREVLTGWQMAGGVMVLAAAAAVRFLQSEHLTQADVIGSTGAPVRPGGEEG